MFFYLSYDFKIFFYCVFGVKTSKFCHKYVSLLWASFHNVTCCRESANHLWFIDFNVWYFFTPRCHMINKIILQVKNGNLRNQHYIKHALYIRVC